MLLRFKYYLLIVAFCLLGHSAYAQEGSLSDEQMKAAADAADQEEINKERAPWHFLLSVKEAKMGMGHAGNKVELEGTMDQVYKSPPSQGSVKSKTLKFSYYCGNTMPDTAVDPCKPYLESSHLEVWGKFALGSDGEPAPDTFIVVGMTPP
jgi:hypothetical protein